MKNPVLVTGGAGYIGSHACKALAAAGYLPITYDDLSRGNAWAVKWGPLVEGRLQDRACLDEVLARYRPGAVLHFAAFAYVGESMEKPALYRENNVDGGESLIAAVKTAGIPRVVYSSSCALYGDPVHLPVDEEHPLKPLSPYGETKLAVEELLRATPEISSVSLRYFNAAGADPADNHRRDLCRGNPQGHFGQREFCICSGDHHVGDTGQAQSARHRKAFDKHDEQLRQGVHGAQQPAEIRVEAHDVIPLAVPALKHRLEQLKITPGAERAALAAQNHKADIPLPRQGLQHGGKLVRHCLRQGVAHFGPIEPDGQDITVLVENKIFYCWQHGDEVSRESLELHPANAESIGEYGAILRFPAGTQQKTEHPAGVAWVDHTVVEQAA